MKLKYPSEAKKLEGSNQLLSKLEKENWEDLSCVQIDYLEGYNKIIKLFEKDTNLIKSTDTINVYQYAEQHRNKLCLEFVGTGLKTDVDLAEFVYEQGGNQAIKDILELNQHPISE